MSRPRFITSGIITHLIPILHDIRDDHPVIEKIMEMIFLLPVKISLRNELPLHPDDSFPSLLGEAALGVDFTTGNLLFDEGVDEIHIKVGPMSNEAFQQFVPGTTNSKILQLLIDYLLPVHVDIITEFDLMGSDRLIRLADESGDNNTMLGEDTYL